MKFNQELIEKFRRGEIAMSNIPHDPELVKSVLTEVLQKKTISTGKTDYYRMDMTQSGGILFPTNQTPIIDYFPVKDFVVIELHEFSNDGVKWVKGEEISSAVRRGQLLHMVELQTGGLFVYTHKRDIQPKVIERWVNVTPTRAVSIQAYPSEQQAKSYAGPADIQVKLKGEIL